MNYIDISSFNDLESIKEQYTELQERLLTVESVLDDLVRSAEIATLSKQFYLLDSFIKSAQVCLEDRIVLPEPEIADDNNITIITDDNTEPS